LECDCTVADGIEVIIGHDPALFFMCEWVNDISLLSSGATGEHLWKKGGLLSFGHLALSEGSVLSGGYIQKGSIFWQ
jgi:hypothetical protein